MGDNLTETLDHLASVAELQVTKRNLNKGPFGSKILTSGREEQQQQQHPDTIGKSLELTTIYVDK